MEEEKEEAILKEARRLQRIGVAPERYTEEYVRTPTQRRVREEIRGLDHEDIPFMPAYETEKLRLLGEATAKAARRREAREEARERAHLEATRKGRLNGRSYKPFGVPLRSYQSGGQEE